MNENDASDILASALKEMDDIIKNNDFSPSPESPRPPCYSPSPRWSNNSVSSPRLSNSSGSPRSPPFPGKLPPEKRAAALLSDLKSCVAEVSNSRNILRELSVDSQLFLKQLASEIPGRPTDPESFGLPMRGNGSIEMAARNDEDKRRTQDEVIVLKEQLEAQKERILELERERPSQVSLSHKLDLMAEISRQKVQINSLEADKKELVQLVDDLKNDMGELKLKMMKQENELESLKKTVPAASPVFSETLEHTIGGGVELNPAATSTPVVTNGAANGSRPQSTSSGGSLQQGAAQKSNSMGELRLHKVALDTVHPPLETTATPPSRPRDIVRADNGALLLPRHASMGKGRFKRDKDDDLLDDKGEKLRKAFGDRSKRPGSEDLDPSGPFQRGGMRATAGPRLGLQLRDQKPEDFSAWDCDHVCTWLHQMGLGVYVINCRRWLRHGSQLLQASKKEIEKALAIRHPLHLKKILVHMNALKSGVDQPISNSFSMHKWLDDIGLLHYLSLFQAAAVDGKVLDQLNMEDLHCLKITNELHVMSLRRGLQVLRHINFDLSRLKRRPAETCERPSALEVCLWSHHQVMDWLRKIELPEYASNLRGSGVHGALMILEDRFTADLLASVLNIPSSKTLLRRHLSSQFQELIGPEKHARKRDVEAVPLTITSKIKPWKKRNFFFSKKPRHDLHDGEDLLCPKNIDSTSGAFDLQALRTLNPTNVIMETDIDELVKMSLIEYEKAPSTNV